jgi:hypothetical protein
MGGGKDGNEPIYRPQGTPALEGILTAMALGRASESNPALNEVIGHYGSNLDPLGLGVGQSNRPSSGNSNVSMPSMSANNNGISSGKTLNPMTAGAKTQGVGDKGQEGQGQGTPGSSDLSRFSPNTNPVNFNDLLRRTDNLDATYSQGPNTQYTQPQYQNTQFQERDISGVPDQAYNDARNQSFEDIAKTNKQSIAQGTRALSRSGLGRSGLSSGVVADANRASNDSMSQASRSIGASQAQSKVDTAKFNVGQQFQREQAQAGENKFQTELDRWRQQQQGAENLSRDQLNLQGKQSAFSQGLQKVGSLGSLQSQRQQQQMEPYTMLSQLYGQNIGIPISGGGGGKGDPFSALLGAGAQVGSAALLCLPEDAMIEVDDNHSVPITTLKVGDEIKGGKVLMVCSRIRPENHIFSVHRKHGKIVVMTAGHPSFDEFEEIQTTYHASPTTNDILTSEGYYYVNGIKLGSTLEDFRNGL